MAEFPILTKDELDAGQRSLWDELTLGPRGFYTGGPDAGRLPDLYNAWLQFPEFGKLMLRLGDVIRAHSELPGKLRELVVLTTSSLLNARVEYEFHIPFARNEGLSDAVIAAIGEGAAPQFSNEAERIIYEANVQLLRTATLTERTREEVVKIIGFRGLVQLIAAVSLYVVTAHTTNVAKVKLAEDFSADPEKLKDFFAGKHVHDDRR
ncbi:MAG: carboxymuconolactone decarboxylase family protein [Rhizomicrobium sp.]